MLYMELNKYLETEKVEADVKAVITAAAVAGIEIYEALKKQPITYAVSKNSSGETQLSHDLLADKILETHLAKTEMVRCFVSEERTNDVCFLKSAKANLLVAFDPIDGSSVAGAGLAVGTSLGIYKGKSSLLECTGRDQVAALYLLYGPRVLLVYSVGKGVHLLAYNEEKKCFYLEQSHLKLRSGVKVCSIGSLQHSCSIVGFPDLILEWERRGFSQRYSGSMVADINGILYRGGGIFAYPNSKLRLLYEGNPFAFLVEQAGGKARDMCGRNILDLTITSIDATSPILIGEAEEVSKSESFLGKNCSL